MNYTLSMLDVHKKKLHKNILAPKMKKDQFPVSQQAMRGGLQKLFAMLQGSGAMGQMSQGNNMPKFPGA